MKTNSIETIGFIIKEEILESLNHDIIPNTFVLINRDPFPGYHGQDLPGESANIDSVFFVTKQKYSTEQIYRASNNIKRYFVHEFDAVQAEVNVFNDKFPCIRVRNLKSFDQIAELQSCLKDEGFKFAKRQKVSTSGLIKVYKNFNLEQTEDFFYTDLEDKEMLYFELPAFLTWKMFEKITYSIKNNMTNHNFDLAQGGIYRKNGLLELVRVYEENCNMDKVKELRNKYLAEIKKHLV